MRAFYWLWLKAIFHRPSWVDAVASVVGLLAALAAHYWPNSVIVQHLWELPVFGFAALGLLRVIAAPYELWKEQKSRADEVPPEQRPFDVTIWDGIGEFRLYQAACLWTEHSPPSGATAALPNDAVVALHRIKRGLRTLAQQRIGRGVQENGAWVAVFAALLVSNDTDVDNSTIVSRAALEDCAELLEEYPSFLFEKEATDD